MKKYKSLAALLLGLLLSAALFPMQALAAGSIDLNRDASLTITEKYGEQPLSGVRFELYLVSTVDETGELTPAPAFEKYAAELDIRGQNDSAWQALAEKLDRELPLSRPEADPGAVSGSGDPDGKGGLCLFHGPLLCAAAGAGCAEQHLELRACGPGQTRPKPCAGGL